MIAQENKKDEQTIELIRKEFDLPGTVSFNKTLINFHIFRKICMMISDAL